MSLRILVQAPDGGLTVHAVELVEEGGEPVAPEAVAVASGALANFGVESGERHYIAVPPLAADDPACLLAAIVLMVAEGLGHTVANLVLAVGWSVARSDVEPLPLDLGVAPLPASLAGSGVVLDDARPGIGQPSLAEAARELGPVRGAGVNVLGVTSLDDVLCGAFAGGEWRFRPAWPGESVSRAANHLFHLVLRDFPNVLSWDSIVSIARAWLLAQGTGGDQPRSAERWKVEFARDVARRHRGESVMPPWPGEDVFASFTPAERLAVMAHLVQGAADGNRDLVPSTIDEARTLLEAYGRVEPERAAEIWGAIGRAQVCLGDFGEGIAALMRACSAWQQLGRADRSSLAACELLRVSALAHAQAGRAAATCGEHPDTTESSRDYLALAQGRAAVHLEQWDRAIQLLHPSERARLRSSSEVELGALRWRHRALLGARRDDEAARVMAELVQRGESDQLHLARLDLALARGGNWEGALRDLFGVVPEGQEALATWTTIVGRSADPRPWRVEDARRLADEYRY